MFAPSATVTSTPVISESAASTKVKSAEAPISALWAWEVSARPRVNVIPPAGAVCPSNRVRETDRAVVPLFSVTLVWSPGVTGSASTSRRTGRSLSRMVTAAGRTVKSETTAPATVPAMLKVSSVSRSESSMTSSVNVTAELELEPAGIATGIMLGSGAV